MKRSRLFPDFVFLDDYGSPHALRDVLGDFTVLALTSSEDTTHGPAGELLTAIVAENRGGIPVDVRGIDVHSPGAPCERHDACHLVDAQAGVLVLCDPTGAIRRLYGVGHEDRLFVIGPNRHVIDTALDRHVGRLRLQLSLDVALCTDEAAGSRSRELTSGRGGNSRPTAERETPGARSTCGGLRGNGSGQ